MALHMAVRVAQPGYATYQWKLELMMSFACLFEVRSLYA